MSEEDGNAHGFLKACYMNHDLPVGTRMKAAAIAIGYERPRLASMISANFNIDATLGGRLERANKRVALMRKAQAEGNPSGWIEPFREFCSQRREPKLIEAKAEPINEEGGSEAELGA